MDDVEGPPELLCLEDGNLSEISFVSGETEKAYATFRKRKGGKLSNEKCWLCGIMPEESGGPAESCRVFPGADKDTNQWLQAKGLINFHLDSPDNTIILCELCHKAYRTVDTWHFYPTCLLYFINFEYDDYQRRIGDGIDGIKSPRRTPAMDDLLAYEKKTDFHPPNVQGCLYSTWLYDQGNGEEVPNKMWSGAPMAPVCRALHVARRNRQTSFGLPLQVLEELYDRPDPDVYKPAAIPGSLGLVDAEFDGEFDAVLVPPPQEKEKEKEKEQEQQREQERGDSGTQSPNPRPRSRPVPGPDSYPITENVRRRYRKVAAMTPRKADRVIGRNNYDETYHTWLHEMIAGIPAREA